MTVPTQRIVPILVYADIGAAHDYLVGTLGLSSGGLHRDGDGNVVHGEVSVDGQVIWLHQVSPDYGLTSPNTNGASTGMIAVIVDDVEQHHGRARAAGSTIVLEPTDQPYGFREYSALGPEGELWSFMTPLG